MIFSVSNKNITKLKSQCLLIPVDSNGNLSKSGKLIDKALNRQLSQKMIIADLQASTDNSLLIPLVQHPIQRVLLVAYDQAATDEKMLTAAARSLNKYAIEQAHSLLHEANTKSDMATKIQQAILCFNQVFYRFDRLKSEKTPCPLQSLCFLYQSDQPRSTLKNFEDLRLKHKDVTANEIKQAVIESNAIANAINLTKDLANLPANICTPSFLAKQAQQLAKKHARLSSEIIDATSIKKLGMGAFLSVTKGSDEAAKMIILQYKGSAGKQKPIALIGKGVTFDNGGLNLKAGAGMATMKYDMCGAATIIAMMQLVAELKLPINVVAIAGATENMVNGKASRPGDVVKTLSGKTIEIMNTDAEGRLILCDLLTYCQQHYQPSLVIDVATLTGGAIIALGHENSCLFSNNQALSNELITAGKKMNDGVWQLPITEEAKSFLSSTTADFRNVPSVNNRTATTITAACFLSLFIDNNCPWAHLDIAATAAGNDMLTATGRPVPLLARYLIDKAS